MPATRTLRMRVVIANPSLHLRPGMFAAIRLFGAPRERATLIPTEAVISTGVRSVVIVADDSSHFHPVPVTVGAQYGGKSEVLLGLTPGQRVVASGQFLIDSEAALRGAFNNLTGPGDGKTEAPDANLEPPPSPERLR
jgi:Cu(I)/Ag(I) efflux system membrane fusion protein